MKDRVRALVVLVAVFLIGCLLGTAGTYYWFKKYPGTQNVYLKEDGPPPPHGRQRLPELLKMTPVQESRFAEIMKETRQKLDAMQMEQRPRIEAVLEEANQRVFSILDEQQKKKYKDFLDEIKKWRSRDHGNRRFGPPPGGPDRGMPAMPRDDGGRNNGSGANPDNHPHEGGDPFR